VTTTAARASVPERLAPDVVAAIVAGRHGDPFAVLGPLGPDFRRVRVFLPGAARVAVIDRNGSERGLLDQAHPDGLFEGPLDLPRDAYRLRVAFPTGTVELEDPYRFPPILGEVDVHLLAEGSHQRLYEKLGAHPLALEGVAGTAFAVWAPNAARVSVVGSFNGWDGRRHPMRKRIECGVWELFLPHVAPGDLYKYELIAADGTLLPLKADPFAFRAEHPPSNASVVHGLVRHSWRDEAWLEERQQGDPRRRPMSIYECHLGSWARVPEEGGRYLSYLELGERLIPYVKGLGFTHIELMPVSEYPFDGSWGYQPTGLFAPTIRHGTPEEFAAFVDRAHAEGIGVIIDWVPGHFPTDAHGLGRFDGTALYEHEDPRQGVHQDWNTLIYNYGRAEVANYLIANALFWLDRFHIDGLRVDAVASMLYLDYSRPAGAWVPNRFGGNENLEAIAFLRRMNELTYAGHPGIVTIAEESTAFAGVSRPVYLGGLGFGFKWNMGWMHDTLAYMSRDPVHRKYHQNNLTFGLLYAFSENFVLPLSHDEVVHGKGSLLAKMPGDRWQKFANLRAYYGFMWTHPGKKLLFMGGELGQEREWNHDTSLDWHLLDDPLHAGLKRLVRDLNLVYRHHLPLHELDCEGEGFEWIDANDSQQSVISFLRRDRAGRVRVVICNFTPVVREGYRLGVPQGGPWAELINTDAAVYGGSDRRNPGMLEAEESPWHGRPWHVRVTLPPLATVVLTPEPG
jgi:1,4-alpha-glucan branching enzyme